MKKISVIICICFAFFACNNNGQENLDHIQNSSPVVISNAAHKGSCVYLTSDAQDNPLISWCETDTTTKNKFFFMAFYDDAKGTFGDPISIPIQKNASLHEEGMPKVAVRSDGTVIALYETSDPTKENNFAGYIYYLQSSDHGKTWTDPMYLHKDTSAGKDHSFASVTRLSNGEIGACWLDVSLDPEREGRSVLFAKTVGNGGFGKETLIDSLACECCRTDISSDKSGRLSIVFRDILKGSIRDIAIRTSDDNGDSFKPVVSFSDDGWVMDGCPHNGPSAVTNNDHTYAVWFTGGKHKGIYFADVDNNEHVISKKLVNSNGRFSQVCMMPDNDKVIAYNETLRKNDSFFSPITLLRIKAADAYAQMITPTNVQATYPVLQSVKGNNVIVAWEQNGSICYKKINTENITVPAETMASDKNKRNGYSPVEFVPKKEMSHHME